MGDHEATEEHRPDQGACLRPQGMRMLRYPARAGVSAEWWVTNERGERLVRARYCPWCGEAL